MNTYRLFYFGLANEMLHNEIVEVHEEKRAIAIAEELARCVKQEGTVELWHLEECIRSIPIEGDQGLEERRIARSYGVFYSRDCSRRRQSKPVLP